MSGPVRRFLDFFGALLATSAARSFLSMVAREQSQQMVELLDAADTLERSSDPTRRRLGQMLRADFNASIARGRDEAVDAAAPTTQALPGATRPLALEASGPAATPETTSPAATTKRRGRPPGKKSTPRPPESSSSPETATGPSRDGEGTTPTPP